MVLRNGCSRPAANLLARGVLLDYVTGRGAPYPACNGARQGIAYGGPYQGPTRGTADPSNRCGVARCIHRAASYGSDPSTGSTTCQKSASWNDEKHRRQCRAYSETIEFRTHNETD